MRWLSELLSKDDSGVSFGRVACCFVILYVAAMTTIAMFSAKQMPATVADFPLGWVYIVGVLWGSDKLSDMIARKKGGVDG